MGQIWPVPSFNRGPGGQGPTRFASPNVWRASRPEPAAVGRLDAASTLLRMPSPPSPSPRFERALFRGRCRRNLLGGLALLIVALVYAGWAGDHFRRRGADATAFDQPLVRAAGRMVVEPVHLRAVKPQNNRELYLLTVVSDQQDVMSGLVVLLLRIIVALTTGGFGLVLATAGATEWEIRSRGAGERRVTAAE
jgi:hypothetical protein